MNVAIICHDHRLSGANLSLLDFLKGRIDCVNITVIIPRHNKQFIDSLKKIGINDIIVGHYIFTAKKLYKTNLKQKIKDIIKFFYASCFNIPMYKRLVKKIKQRNIDIIHTNSFATMAGAYISEKTNIPHIFHIREFMEEDHQFTHYNKKKIIRYCQNSYAIFISDVIANKYLNKYKFLSTTTIYDQVSYNSEYKKNRDFMEDDICNIIFVGTIAKNKGIIDAINCIKLLNDNNLKAKLYICGVGPHEEEIKKYVSSNKIDNILFLGYVSNILDIRKNMDIALMCSKQEALGRVTIEAQYYENLIIGANCGCTPYLIKDNITGLLYNNNIQDDLYKRVLFAINNKSKSIDNIRNAKKESISIFSKDIFEQIFKFYKRVLKEEKNNE